MDTHFESDELGRVPFAGWTAPERRRALAHFGRGCPECWWSLEELAVSWGSVPAGFEDPGTVEKGGAPVAQAIERCLAFLSAKDENATRFAALRPIHRHALETTCTETHTRKRALAFRRLVLEECRHLVLREPSQLIERLWITLNEMPDPFLLEREPQRMLALEALGWIYLADDCRVTGRLTQADKLLAKAQRLMDVSPCDSEIYATFFELKADLARTRGNFLGALDLLRSAGELLKSCRVPGRRAETFLRLGLVRMRFGNPATAAEEFRAALDDIPPDLSPRLRLDALHHLAAAEIRQGLYGAAQRTLEKAERHYGDRPSDLIWARRAWLWGIVYLEARNEAAERMLRTAADLFLKMDLTLDSAHTLMELGGLYARRGCRIALRGVTRELVELMSRPKARELPHRKRWEIVLQAKEKGLDEALLAMLDDSAEEQLVN